jgi:hypothetical protein
MKTESRAGFACNSGLQALKYNKDTSRVYHHWLALTYKPVPP